MKKSQKDLKASSLQEMEIWYADERLMLAEEECGRHWRLGDTVREWHILG